AVNESIAVTCYSMRRFEVLTFPTVEVPEFEVDVPVSFGIMDEPLGDGSDARRLALPRAAPGRMQAVGFWTPRADSIVVHWQRGSAAYALVLSAGPDTLSGRIAPLARVPGRGGVAGAVLAVRTECADMVVNRAAVARHMVTET